MFPKQQQPPFWKALEMSILALSYNIFFAKSFFLVFEDTTKVVVVVVNPPRQNNVSKLSNFTFKIIAQFWQR